MAVEKKHVLLDLFSSTGVNVSATVETVEVLLEDA